MYARHTFIVLKNITFLFIVLVASAGSAQAQAEATVRGEVTTAAGAPVPLQGCG
jgi:hypothetical protein